MRRGLAVLGLAVALAAAAVAAMFAGGPSSARASSHSEAPLISQDPRADNTDLYAFVSPDNTNTVSIVANYIPLEAPASGPNFPSFDDSVLYEIKIDNNGDGRDDLSYQFRFTTQTRNPNTFLYNVGPITSLSDTNWNRPQTYSVTLVHFDKDGSVVEHGKNGPVVLADNVPTPPDNIGPRSTPNYNALAAAAVTNLNGGGKVFAGQRDDPFYVDLGSIFDLAGLRPFNPFHLLPLGAEAGRDALKNYNTHSIVLQVPISQVLASDSGRGRGDDGPGHDKPGHDGPKSDSPKHEGLKTESLKRKGDHGQDSTPSPIVGIYASASRAERTILEPDGTKSSEGDWVQVSRLGNPLINEVVIPLGQKDFWNRSEPQDDSQFESRYTSPELAGLENLLYGAPPPVGAGHPGGALKAIDTSGRDDLKAILLTGVTGVNFTGPNDADLLRLNTNIKPGVNGACPGGTASAAQPDRLAVLNADICGFPNGRRLADDVVDIELRAVAQGYGSFLNGAFGLPNKSPNNLVGDGVDANDVSFSNTFPYVAAPHQGYEVP